MDQKNKNKLILGCSVHSVEDAIEAEKLGASYLTAGHISVSYTHLDVYKRQVKQCADGRRVLVAFQLGNKSLGQFRAVSKFLLCQTVLDTKLFHTLSDIHANLHSCV